VVKPHPYTIFFSKLNILVPGMLHNYADLGRIILGYSSSFHRLRPMQTKDCNIVCIKYCPLVRSDVEAIKIEEDEKKPIIFEALCSGCGICVRKCPFKAITIINLQAS